MIALWIAGRDVRTPRRARFAAIVVAAYALSPIDLIPDMIPVLGYLDDLILVPLGIAVVVRLIPLPLMAEFRASAAERSQRPSSRTAGAFVVLLWIAMTIVLLRWAAPLVRAGWGSANPVR